MFAVSRFHPLSSLLLLKAQTKSLFLVRAMRGAGFPYSTQPSSAFEGPPRPPESSSELKTLNDIPAPNFTALLTIMRNMRNSEKLGKFVYQLIEDLWKEHGDIVRFPVGPLRDPMVVVYR